MASHHHKDESLGVFGCQNYESMGTCPICTRYYAHADIEAALSWVRGMERAGIKVDECRDALKSALVKINTAMPGGAS